MKICTFASGSSGNCAFVSHNDTYLLVDAGISLRRITRSLLALGVTPDQLSGILITHEHTDHISALKMMTKYHAVPIYAATGTAESLSELIPEVMTCVHSFRTGVPFSVGELEITSFPTPHDTRESVGYRISDGERSLAFLTDLGFVPPAVFDAVAGVDAAVLESNHDVTMLRTGRYPYPLKRRILADRGHLSNDECARLAAALAQKGTRRIILAHLSRENNTPERAFAAVSGALEQSDCPVELCVAPAAEPGELYTI